MSMDNNQNPTEVTTTTAPATTTPAAEAAQENAFQRFLQSLFNGSKADEGAVATEGADKSEQEKDPAPPSKTYTEADLAAEKQRWSDEVKEQERLAKLSPDERLKADVATKDKEVENLRAQLLRKELKDEAMAAFSKDGFPVGLAELLNFSSKDTMQSSMTTLQGVFKQCLEAAVNERLRGKTPEGLGHAGNAQNAIRDQIAKNIRGGLN